MFCACIQENIRINSKPRTVSISAVTRVPQYWVLGPLTPETRPHKVLRPWKSPIPQSALKTSLELLVQVLTWGLQKNRTPFGITEVSFSYIGPLVIVAGCSTACTASSYSSRMAPTWYIKLYLCPSLQRVLQRPN